MDTQTPLNRTDTVLDFLLSRRSVPAKTLDLPVPDRDVVETILTAGMRSPDHGKLEPWRFLVLERPALERLASAVPARGLALGLEAEKTEKMQAQFGNAHLAIAVISAPTPTEKVPEIEQTLSAGAVCLAMLNTALALGWGANWLSGWASHDRDFVEAHLGLGKGEYVAGFIHLGTPRVLPPERPRPNISNKTQWIEE